MPHLLCSTESEAQMNTITSLLMIAAATLTVATGQAPQLLQLYNCDQSSEWPFETGGPCNRAIDGNTNQIYGAEPYSCMHTNSDAGGSWWQAETEFLAVIQRIQIYNRIDCCSDRLKNFTITVDGALCYQDTNGDTFSVKNFTCNSALIGRRIRVTLFGQKFLHFCELQAFGSYLLNDPHQLRFSTCNQSTKSYKQDCRKAIDGRIDCESRGKTYASTRSHSWWQGTLSHRSKISEIRIYNSPSKKTDRPSNFDIAVDGVKCNTYVGRKSFSVKVFKCRGTGQTIRITSRLGSPLALCEVQAFGILVTAANQQIDGFQKIGCFTDNALKRDLPMLAALNDGSLTLQKCAQLCLSLGNSHFGVQRGSDCWCGNEFGRYGGAGNSSCSIPCFGDASESCGGVLLNLVYKIV